MTPEVSNTNSSETFGQRMKRLRLENGYQRQHDLARALRVSNQAVSWWETDRRKPIWALVVRLSQLFHVRPEYLRSGREAPEGQEALF